MVLSSHREKIKPFSLKLKKLLYFRRELSKLEKRKLYIFYMLFKHNHKRKKFSILSLTKNENILN